MGKLALAIQYKGTNFSGFQKQPGERTVQGVIEEALTSFYQRKVNVIGASRTDAGAHALINPVAFDDVKNYGPQVVMRAMNAVLPDDVKVIESVSVAEEFHPRKDALYREYVYLVRFSDLPDVFLGPFSHQEKEKVNESLIKEAASFFIGMHDFRSFTRKSAEMRNCVRNMIEVKFEKEDSKNLGVFIFRADGFLYGMVRNIVSTILDYSKGRIRKEDILDLLRFPQDNWAPEPVPACGLFLSWVEYEEKIFNRVRFPFFEI